MNKHCIHYDCDPGQDDAIALLFALGAGVEITGISVVGGNVDVLKCARNALQLLELTNKTDIPVYLGAAQPLKRLSQPLPDVFGECGMAGADLPDPSKKLEEISAAEFLISAELPYTLVLTGPLTNLALALHEKPEIINQVKRLIMMGGCVYPEKIHGRLGNIQVKGSNEWAEYNFAVDPEAAQIVFSAGFEEIFLVPLEVTRSVLYGHKLDKRLRDVNRKVATVAANILSTVGSEDRQDYAFIMEDDHDPVRAMHDVVAMAFLTNPEIFQIKTLPLKIITGVSPAAAGQSIIDKNEFDHASVQVVMGLDRNEFFDRIVEYLAKL